MIASLLARIIGEYTGVITMNSIQWRKKTFYGDSTSIYIFLTTCIKYIHICLAIPHLILNTISWAGTYSKQFVMPITLRQISSTYSSLELKQYRVECIKQCIQRHQGNSSFSAKTVTVCNTITKATVVFVTWPLFLIMDWGIILIASFCKRE